MAQESSSQKGSSKDFHHPFQPYRIQLEFMNTVYDCIQKRQVGILESPTGTSIFCSCCRPCLVHSDILGYWSGQGKSLSLICGALTWLREQQDGFELADGADDEPEWIQEHAIKAKADALMRTRTAFESRLAKIREKERRQKERFESAEPQRKRVKVSHGADALINEHEEQYLLDYESDSERGVGSVATAHGTEGVSSANLELMVKLGMAFKPSADEEEEVEQTVKIFFCSRTHSQLSQFVSELRRVKLPPAESSSRCADAQSGKGEMTEEIKHLSLGSRKNLCINPQVAKLGHQTAINERCIELQQGKAAENRRCEFLPTKENEPLVHQFRDHALAQVRDIEDLGVLGKKIGICPYYASRAVIKPSEIVTLPYPLMLQKSAREALGLSLKDHVVIIDEAHNLMDAISGIHSVSISLSQLRKARQQVGIYLQKFQTKLKGKNRVYVTQLVRLIDSLAAFLEGKAALSKESDGIVNLVDLMSGKGVDQINLYKLSHYLEESKLARKVDGYVTHAQEGRANEKSEAVSPVLMQVQSFFQVLTYPSAEGRFFYAKLESEDYGLRYLLLDPLHHFKDIVEEARAVILAGGTMSPMDDYTRYLFPYLPPERIRTLSCGHIVLESHLCAWPVGNGPTGTALDFTFEKRQHPATVAELGRCVRDLAKTIPDGLVVFFPSYAYLEHVVTAWRAGASGSGRSGLATDSAWDQILVHKNIFRESKTSSTDDVLRAYAAAIEASAARSTGPQGALLLAVIGGRLSEGINFADRLGRGVAVVGLPFPNARSAEWKARLAHVERQQGGGAAGAAAAREYYENACMRAVNQSIGRAIRHKGDYASIVLLDRRYGTARIKEKLPGWIRAAVERNAGSERFGAALEDMRRFFAEKR